MPGRSKVKTAAPVPVEDISRSILILRRQRVLLDTELASLYGVTTKRLNEQVKRNIDRFPEDFMFRLTREEIDALNRSQSATGSQRHRDPRFPPFAFAEHGAIMAASILNSKRAVEMSIYVVRAFVQLRGLLASNKELSKRLEALEVRVTRKFAKQDEVIVEMVKAIRELTKPSEPKRRGIGFMADWS